MSYMKATVTPDDPPKPIKHDDLQGQALLDYLKARYLAARSDYLQALLFQRLPDNPQF